jgi:hypothetical protein
VVEVAGENFTPGASLTLTWSGLPLGVDPSPVQVDPAGRFSLSLVIPNDFAGPHLVRVSDGSRLAQFTFTLGQICQPPPPTETSTPVASPTPTETPTPTATPHSDQPRLRCEPETAIPDQTITVYGQNFHPGGHFHQLRWDGVAIPWAPGGLTVGDDGTFTLWFTAPSDTYELHTLVADDGRGGLAACYLDLMPRDPTPTWTPTPTLTPTPTATWTPGPPPRITVTPTLEPSPFDTCAEAEAVFTRAPLVDTTIEAGIVLTNTHLAWPDGQMQVGLWQYHALRESDTGVRLALPALDPGEAVTVRQPFQANRAAGPVWFQVRLLDSRTGQASVCTSAWFVLHVKDDEPYAPPLVSPPADVWLSTRTLELAWLPADRPPGAAPVDGYELRLLDLSGGDLLAQLTGPEVTGWPYPLTTDYGQLSLAWQARAHNAAGWGRWATPFYFGVDTVRPSVDMALSGAPGQAGWWRSPLTVRLGGGDPAPGSGLAATYLQVGETRWVQVIPGGVNLVEGEGEYDLRAYGRDRALNRSPVAVKPVRIDYTAPHQLEVLFSHEPTSSGWYVQPLTLTLVADDLVSGVAERLIRFEEGGWQTDVLTLTGEGSQAIEYMARDMAGNETELRQTTARLDLSPPAGALALNGSLCQSCPPAMASLAGGDALSGIAHWTLTLDPDTVLAAGSEPDRDVELAGSRLPAGPLILRLSLQDRAGWLTTQELVVTNAPAEAGPTPTPWVMVTATPWPTVTPGTFPYVTITPVPTVPGSDHGGGDNDDDDDGDGDRGGGSNGGDGRPRSSLVAGPGYPVGGTVVPAILPVTGAIDMTSQAGRGAGPEIARTVVVLVLIGLGLTTWLVSGALRKNIRGRHRQDCKNIARKRHEQ